MLAFRSAVRASYRKVLSLPTDGIIAAQAALAEVHMASWVVIGPRQCNARTKPVMPAANVAFARDGVLLHSVPRRLTAPDPSWPLA
jgi:hypothetical protein